MRNVVLLGLKGHQGTCLQEISRREDVRLAAVWDDDAAAVEKLRGAHFCDDETLLTTDRDELLALDDVQVAVLAEDNAARPRNLLACAERGWHLVAEKPLALSLSDLDQVRAAVDRAGVRLSMLLTMRFDPPYLAMRDAVRGGAVGQPLLLAAQKSYRRGTRPAWQQNHDTFGGTIPFIGIHMLDMLHYVTGCEYKQVAALQHNEGLPGAGSIEETASLLLETDQHGIAQLRLDYLRPQQAPTHGDDRVRIAGPEGVIETIGGTVTLLTHDQAPLELALPEPGNLFGSFLDELDGNGTHPISAEECYRATEISLRAREAAETGKWVAI